MLTSVGNSKQTRTSPDQTFTILDALMPNPIARAARWRAYAAASLANGEAAKDEKTRQVHLDIAKHFLSMAGQEVNEVKRRA